MCTACAQEADQLRADLAARGTAEATISTTKASSRKAPRPSSADARLCSGAVPRGRAPCLDLDPGHPSPSKYAGQRAKDSPSQGRASPRDEKKKMCAASGSSAWAAAATHATAPRAGSPHAISATTFHVKRSVPAANSAPADTGAAACAPAANGAPMAARGGAGGCLLGAKCSQKRWQITADGSSGAACRAPGPGLEGAFKQHMISGVGSMAALSARVCAAGASERCKRPWRLWHTQDAANAVAAKRSRAKESAGLAILTALATMSGRAASFVVSAKLLPHRCCELPRVCRDIHRSM